MQSALGLGGLSITIEYTGHSAGIHMCMYSVPVYISPCVCACMCVCV